MWCAAIFRYYWELISSQLVHNVLLRTFFYGIRFFLLNIRNGLSLNATRSWSDSAQT
jgi:hypothetical protein